jgi:hypothetical protein
MPIIIIAANDLDGEKGMVNAGPVVAIEQSGHKLRNFYMVRKRAFIVLIILRNRDFIFHTGSARSLGVDSAILNFH